MDKIDWRVLQRMLIDFPSVNYDTDEEEKSDGNKLKLTPQTRDEFFAQLKKHSKK